MRDLTLVADNTAMSRFDMLQAQESLSVHVLARELVDRVLSQDWEDTDRRIQARARYLCTHAIRSMQDGWEREARKKAKAAVIHAMKTECGAIFSALTPAHYDALASILVTAVLDTAKGVTEGSTPMAPSDYLRVGGQR
jgi:hypothetical protein